MIQHTWLKKLAHSRHLRLAIVAVAFLGPLLTKSRAETLVMAPFYVYADRIDPDTQFAIDIEIQNRWDPVNGFQSDLTLIFHDEGSSQVPQTSVSPTGAGPIVYKGTPVRVGDLLGQTWEYANGEAWTVFLDKTGTNFAWYNNVWWYTDDDSITWHISPTPPVSVFPSDNPQDYTNGPPS